jgi:O-antigen/teichoic acid export membrane protein
MIPVVTVNVLYDQATTGYFDLTRQVLALPLALISVALAQIILQDVSERRNSGKLVNRQITNTFLVLVLISIPGVILILLFGETLFGYIFGDEWTMSGKIAQVLVFSYAVKFVVSPLSSVLTALEKLKIMALWRVLYFLAIVSLFFLRNIDAMIFFQVYMILEVTFYVIYFIIILASGLSYDKKIQQNMDSVPK